MVSLKNIDKFLSEKFRIFWQLGKFSLVSTSVTIVQLVLANVLPLVFDGITAPLPVFLRPIFNPQTLFTSPSKYVVDGVVTWGYVLPFFLSNALANIYGYFVNMKVTFEGKGTKLSFVLYVVLMVSLILFSTWLQGFLVARLQQTGIAYLSRTIASMAAGYFQAAVVFPVEKYVLFK